ncbi:MAG: type II secretion system F family protein [Paludibacterium sp.]|uniref:type II secretion system F family protein n=1 Tax=Paludibacterium sp. TaxID=1917523 RepID=UPI0025E443A4|nr:type II secretion system F family protein [Paludibacterium sp.]MBV8046646.1 type II secretion system F family protein [Paludibacterium sp.]
MRLLTLAVLLTVFVAVVAVGTRLLLRWLPDPQLWWRLAALAPRADRTGAPPPAMRLMVMLRRMVEPAEDQGIALRLAQAGWRSEAALTVFYGGKSLLLLTLRLIAWFCLPDGVSGVNRLLVLLLAAVSGVFVPNWLLGRHVAARKQRLQNALPDALELLRVCIEAGLGFDSALTRVTRELSDDCRDLRDEFGLLLLEIDAGVARALALRRMAARAGLEDFSALVTLLVQAERFGTPIGEALKVYTREMRLKRQQRAEEQAGQLAVKLLLPMGLFIFPALFCVLLGPAILRVSRQLLPVLGGSA